jgi:hypothetical protein
LYESPILVILPAATACEFERRAFSENPITW